MTTIYPPAEWRPCSNQSGVMSAHLGLVLHVQEGNNDLGAEFNDPSSQASYTWVAEKDGTLIQYCDADAHAWAQAQGNGTYNSVGTQGFSTESLTEAQCQAIAGLYRWGHDTYGWPYQLAEQPGEPGFGWHGMGGQAWGGHFDCLPLDITEVLTPDGWLPLRDVTVESRVASWSADSAIIDFAPPLFIVPPRVEATVSVAGLEMTERHRLYVYRSDTPSQKVLTAGDVGRVRTNWLIPAQGHADADGCGVGPDLMRLLVWVQADAHYNRAAGGAVEALDWHLAKARKVDRIVDVLNVLGKDFTLHQQGNGTWRLRVYGQQWIADNVLRWLPEKRWGWWLVNADPAEFEALDGELCRADGFERLDMRVYSTAIETNADVIQATYVTHGRSAAKHRTTGQWTVQMHVRRHGHATRDTYQKARSGVPVGCVSTHNDTLLIRQHGRVAIVGNCPGEPRKAQRQHILDLAQGTSPGTPSPPAPSAPSLLSEGSVGPAVSHLQDQLNRDGGYGLTVDGDFGPETDAAVRDFQGRHGLTVDGVVGPQTQAALDADRPAAPTPAPPSPPPPAPPQGPNLAVDGVFGPATISALQAAVGAAVDGVYGPETKMALQRHLGVAADGDIGPITVRALQARVGATQDGDWGPDTTRHLQEALNGHRF